MEISHTADKNASRVIVETPVDSDYCSARQNIQAQLRQHGFRLDSQHGGELPQALPADVVRMAFEDFEHDRGTAHVGTLWASSCDCEAASLNQKSRGRECL